MAEPGTRQQGASVGGMASTADGGLQRASQRSTERGDEDPQGVATSGSAIPAGEGTAHADRGGKNAPGSAPGADRPSRRASGESLASDARNRAGDAEVGEVGAGAGRAGPKADVEQAMPRGPIGRSHHPDEPPESNLRVSQRP